MRAALVVCAALIVGCGGGEAAAPVATPTPPRATRTPAPVLPPSRGVQLKATDGEPVSARYTPAGDGAPAIVLLHEIRARAVQWDELVPELHAAGYATLAYDSRTSPLEHERVADTLGAVRWLRKHGSQHISLVGASIGASTAVLAMARDPRLEAAVALSPVDTPDVWQLQEAGRYRAHDLLLVSDRAEAAAADSMLEGARDSRTLRSAEAGHGVDLLTEPGVRRALFAWLDERSR